MVRGELMLLLLLGQNLLKTEPDCPYDMREAVCTLIWSASRTEIPELVEVKKQLIKKYGRDFEAAAIRNVDRCVNERVIQKLSVRPPSAFLVISYMKEIAKEFKVDWEPDEVQAVDPLAPIPAPTGATVMNAGVSGPDFARLYTSVRLPAYCCDPLKVSRACRRANRIVLQCMQAPPPGASLSHLPKAPSDHASMEAAATPAPLQTSLSRRTVDTYTNQPMHYYSTMSSQPVSMQQSDDVPAERMQPTPALQNEHFSPSAATASSALAPGSVPASNEGIPDFDELTARFERLRKRQDRHDENITSFTF